jgi:hypothetical protein
MSTERWLVGTCLHPLCRELGIGIAKETAHDGAHKGQYRHSTSSLIKSKYGCIVGFLVERRLEFGGGCMFGQSKKVMRTWKV